MTPGAPRPPEAVLGWGCCRTRCPFIKVPFLFKTLISDLKPLVTPTALWLQVPL